MVDVTKFNSVVSSISSIYQPFLDALYSIIDRIGTKAALTAGLDFVIGYAGWYTIQHIDFSNPNPYAVGLVVIELMSMVLITTKYFAARQVQDSLKANGGTTPTTPPTL